MSDKVYRVGLLEFPDNEDSTFADFWGAYQYLDLNYRFVDNVMAIWEDDEPVVLKWASELFTSHGWTWPAQP